MADSNVARLQQALMRYQPRVGFNKSGVSTIDGAWGTKTSSALAQTLAWIAQGNCIQIGDNDACATAAGLMTKFTTIASSNAAGLTSFLDQNADDLNLPHYAAPISSIPVAINPALPTWLQPAAAGGILTTLKMLPTWQKVLLGLVVGFGGLWVYNNHKRA